MHAGNITLSCVCVPATLGLPENGTQERGPSTWQSLTSSLIVVHVDSLQLQVTVSMVTASGVDAMLIADDFPKLETEKEARDGLAS